MLLAVVKGSVARRQHANVAALRNLVRAVRASDERGGQPAAEHFTVMGQAPTEVSAFGVPAGTVTFLMTDIEGPGRLWANPPTTFRSS